MTKEEWAKLDRRNQKNMDAFNHEVAKKSGVGTGSSTGAMGGQTIGPTR